MFDAYLSSITNLNPKYKIFAQEVTSYISNAIEKDMPLYATHGYCTDGGVAGAMMRYAIPGAAIIPLDYWMINDSIFNKIVIDLPWKGIVDLKPFNNHPIDFWVDHHISAMNEVPNARKIRFDMKGDSGSFQLFESNFLGPLPEHIVELAIMTRITDTAGYTTSPPIEQISKLNDLDFSDLEGDNAKINQEKRIWLLDDAFGSVETFKDHLDMYNFLAKDGFLGLSKVLDRVNKRRSIRKNAYEMADNITITADVVVFSFPEETIDKFTILRRLQERGVKVAVSFSVAKDGDVKISLRRNRFLSESENEKIQLQKIASELDGGGHAGASGAHATSVEYAYQKISQWAKSLELKSQLVEF